MVKYMLFLVSNLSGGAPPSRGSTTPAVFCEVDDVWKKIHFYPVKAIKWGLALFKQLCINHFTL